MAGDDNLLSVISTTIVRSKGGEDRLILDYKSEYKKEGIRIVPVAGLEVKVTVPELSSVSGREASNVDVKDLNTDSLAVSLQHAAIMKVTGKTRRLIITTSHAANLDASRLLAETVAITAGNSSRAVLRATRSLAAVTNGAASVQYHGNPANVIVTKSGSSKILQRQ